MVGGGIMQVKEAKKVYRVTIALTPEVRRMLRLISLDTDIPMKQLIEQAIVEFLERHGLLEKKKHE